MPYGQSGDFRDTVNHAFFGSVLVHGIRADIRHPVCAVLHLVCVGVQPAVALDQTVAVGGAPSEPVGFYEFRVAADLLRVLLQLGVVVAFGQHAAVGSPYIAPAVVFRFLCPCHKVEVVFCIGIDIAGGIDIYGSDSIHNLREFLRWDFCSEDGVDGADELRVGLIFGKAARQLGDEVFCLRVVIEAEAKQNLRLRNPQPSKPGCLHLLLNAVHDILYKLQLCLFLCGQVFHHHCLQAAGIDFNVAAEDGYHGYDGHNDDDNDPQHDPADGF